MNLGDNCGARPWPEPFLFEAPSMSPTPRNRFAAWPRSGRSTQRGFASRFSAIGRSKCHNWPAISVACLC